MNEGVASAWWMTFLATRISASLSFASIGWPLLGVAGTARKVAAGQVDLEPVTGGRGVTGVTEVDSQALDTPWRKLARLAGRVAIHRADHTSINSMARPSG
jgi:hypothetical protein